MKYIITESRLQGLIDNYLNTKDWSEWDIGDGEFNLADGKYGKDSIRFRLWPSMIEDLDFEVIYISQKLANEVDKLFSVGTETAITSIINWFNKKYNKNLDKDDFEWLSSNDDEEYDD